MKKDMTFSADFARCGYTKVSRQAMQIAFTPGDKCEKEAKVLLCILGFAYFKKGEVSFHFKDYACERGEWITSYSELARRTGLIRRAAVTAVGHLVEAGWLTVTAVGRMTKFTLTFYDAPPQPDGMGRQQQVLRSGRRILYPPPGIGRTLRLGQRTAHHDSHRSRSGALRIRQRVGQLP